MGLISKTLGQSNPGAVLTALYTAPSSTSTTASVTICNTGVFAETYRVSVAVAGAADHVKQYLAFDAMIAANEFATINSIHLRPTDVIRVYASSAYVTFVAMGSESSG